MSAVPIFKLPIITFQNTKERKQFILDCLIISTAIATLKTSFTHTFSEGVKSLHKNKNRKDVSKIKNAHDYLENKIKLVHSMISLKDMETIRHKTHERAAVSFIKNISMTDREVCLEYVAISILDHGLSRLNRKTPLNKYLKPFLDYELLYEKIGGSVEKYYEMTIEHELARNFVNDLRY